MANKGDKRVQKNSPGSGWVKTGETKDGTNIWTYKGSSGTSGGSGGSGGSGSSGSSGGSSGGSGESASDKKKKRQKYIDAYNNFMDPSGKKKWKPTDKMLDLAVKNDWSMATMYTWVRQFDTNYLQTSAAKALMSNFRTMLAGIFGNQYKLTKASDKKLYNAMIEYAKLAPAKAKNKTTVMTYFKKYVMSSKKFKEMYPAFKAWFNSKTAALSGAFAGLSDPMGFINEYTKRVQLYQSAFRQEQTGVGDVDAEIPNALLMAALENNWSLDGIEWQTAVRNTDAYLGSTGAEVKRQEFESNWERMFQGTQYEDMEPDEDLMEKYVKGNANFTVFFNTTMNKEGTASAALIAAAFPSYAGFIKNNPQYLTGQLDLFGDGGYFDRRSDYIEMYKQMLANPDAMPSEAMLNMALQGSWYDSQWQMYIKQNDPDWISSPSGEAKIEVLERYWDALFGPDSPIDQDIESKWLAGETNTPEDLLSDIQELTIFKESYPDYKVFQTAQVQQGGGETTSPALYKLYESGFNEAFEQQGLNPEDFGQLKTAYFGTGLKGEEFKSYITDWSQRKNIFKVTTGTEAPLEVAGGLAKPEQGGAAAGADLRKRMEQELERYRTFVRTGQQVASQSGMEDDLYKQKI